MKKIYNKLVRDKMVDIYEHDVQTQPLPTFSA